MFDKELQKNLEIYCKISVENAQKILLKFMQSHTILPQNLSHSISIDSASKSIMNSSQISDYNKRKIELIKKVFKVQKEKKEKSLLKKREKRSRSLENLSGNRAKNLSLEPCLHKNLKVFHKIIEKKIEFDLK